MAVLRKWKDKPKLSSSGDPLVILEGVFRLCYTEEYKYIKEEYKYIKGIITFEK